MFTLLCAISIQILKFFCKDRRLLLYMSRTLHLFGTDWCAMMVPIQVIRWYRMQCYDGTDSCAIVVPIRRYCQVRKHYDVNNGYYIKSSRLHKEQSKDLWCFGSCEAITNEYKSNILHEVLYGKDEPYKAYLP